MSDTQKLIDFTEWFLDSVGSAIIVYTAKDAEEIVEKHINEQANQTRKEGA